MFMIPNLVIGLDRIPMVVHIVSGIAVAAFLPLLIMPSKPPTPPSRAVSEGSTPSFFTGIRMLSKNYNFWILFLVHGINVGLSIAFGSIFTQVISPYGYTDAQAGQMNAVAFFAGTLGCCKCLSSSFFYFRASYINILFTKQLLLDPFWMQQSSINYFLD